MNKKALFILLAVVVSGLSACGNSVNSAGEADMVNDKNEVNVGNDSNEDDPVEGLITVEPSELTFFPDQDAPPGTGISIRLKDGELKARVEDKESHGRYKRTLF